MKTQIIITFIIALFIAGCTGTTHYGTYNPAADENAYIAQGFSNFLAGLAQQQQPKKNYQWFAPQGTFVTRPDGLYQWNAFRQQYEYTGYNPQFERLLNHLQQMNR